MADPDSDTMHLNADDAEVDGAFESAEDPTAEAGAFQSDASNADRVGLAESTNSELEAHDADHSASVPNGHAASEAQLQNGHSASTDLEEGSADSAGPPQEPVEEPWKKRLYFVRMPKFPEANQYAVKVLQEEIDVYRSQVQLLNESMNVVRVRSACSLLDHANLLLGCYQMQGPELCC